ncbi:hypothetical protein [Xenorhabdus cabanillasii]|uniref:hypothetical protein n=1 Tax=Xenorhabdus cabanillasii TaxID=351673 RepID=UPI0014748E29|nr:hypothetical protein [Xenorhabdus cabanillasii]
MWQTAILVESIKAMPCDFSLHETRKAHKGIIALFFLIQSSGFLQKRSIACQDRLRMAKQNALSGYRSFLLSLKSALIQFRLTDFYSHSNNESCVLNDIIYNQG